jgi:FlaA1/EpsC-like NDP-sugar epimerase
MNLLGRPDLDFELPDLSGKRILVTGAEGYVGRRVYKLAQQQGAWSLGVDLPLDLTDHDQAQVLVGYDFDFILHLAAAKFAGDGEQNPERVTSVNVDATANVIRIAGSRSQVVFASTCKAADPCTVYGASKLIAERIALNAGGTVVRLVNVIGSTGQTEVTAEWAKVPEDQPLPVTHCWRMWMSLDEAAKTLIAALALEPGRYAPNVPPAKHMDFMAARAFPGRARTGISLRRGDRPRERLVAEYEELEATGGPLNRIVDLWEPRRQQYDAWSAPDPWRFPFADD